MALVLAMGTGVVYAAGEIGSRDLKDNSIKSKDLKNDRAVEGADVRRNSLTADDLLESSLAGVDIVDLAGTQNVGCDPADSVFVDCVSEAVDFERKGKALVIATGAFQGDANSSIECEVRADGVDAPVSQRVGQTTDVTDVFATDGFSRTLVTDTLDAGTHTFALACQQLGANDAEIDAATIAVLSVLRK